MGDKKNPDDTRSIKSVKIYRAPLTQSKSESLNPDGKNLKNLCNYCDK